MKFRKRAVLVDAVLVEELIFDAAHAWNLLPLWIREMYDCTEPGIGVVFTPECIFFKTRLLDIRADIGYWVIRDEQGDITTCGPENFYARYAPAELPLWPIGTSAGGV